MPSTAYTTLKNLLDLREDEAVMSLICLVNYYLLCRYSLYEFVFLFRPLSYSGNLAHPSKNHCNGQNHL